MSNGAACCLLSVCCDRRSPKQKAAFVKLFTHAGLDAAASELAYEALEPYDLVPAGSMEAFKDAIAAEARKHTNDD